MPGVYENKHQDSFPNVYCYVPWQSEFVLDGRLAFIFIKTPQLFSQRLLLCPLTVTVCSQWMPCVYFVKCEDSFPNVYFYVPWQSQFVLDGCLVFMKIMTRYSFPNVYFYVPWQSQFVLDGCLVFMKINTRTLFPMSTAMSPDSQSLFSMYAWRLWK